MKSSLPKESPIASTSPQPIAGSLQLGNLPVSQSSFTDEKNRLPPPLMPFPQALVPEKKKLYRCCESEKDA